MMKKYKLKKGDPVIVITGKFRKTRGVITKVYPNDKVLVSGVNMVTKHKKPTSSSEGGRITEESPIHRSNIAFFDETVNSRTKLGVRFLTSSDKEKPKKVRFAKKSGNDIN